ncbi:MAG: glutamate formimidoyltransferase [candidate division Zixibacteria bacterium]|nr:glutamate formimidoyltransferase [candidate division Zixibacteria bacterium]
MARIVECVPNFSEGRRPEVIGEIVRIIESVQGTTMLDAEMDKDHNRAVVTFVGEPEVCEETAFLAIRRASELIDMEKHSGEHPRMGATDVCPFIPVSGVTMKTCIAMAKRLGERVGKELEIPVYLYESAATRPDRENLAVVRKGEYEAIRDEIATNPVRKPDFGPSKTHPQAGAMAIGARPFLVAFNVYLNTHSLDIAKKIANAIRFQTGGFRYVKAMGFDIKERRQVQISMNLVNYQGTPIHRVYEAIKSEAARYGVMPTSSEIVGLTPLEAIVQVADHYLGFENFTSDQILESKMKSPALAAKIHMKEFIEQVQSKDPTPGGGSVSALGGALAASLGEMVSRLTIIKKQYAKVKTEFQDLRAKLDLLRNELTYLIEKDAQSFDGVMLAMKKPKVTDHDKKVRDAAIEDATKHATSVPLEVMEKTVEVMELLPPVADKGNVNSVSDAGVGNLMARAALEGASLNVRINLPGIGDKEFADKLRSDMEELLKRGHDLFEKTKKIVDGKI